MELIQAKASKLTEVQEQQVCNYDHNNHAKFISLCAGTVPF